MTLLDEMMDRGEGLFRWRSYLPLLTVALFALAMPDYRYPWGSRRLDLGWELLCLAISLFGIALRMLTVGYKPSGTSGRNTKRLRAGALNTTGMYSIVRHPLYLGNFVIWLGVSLYLRAWSLPVIATLAFWLYYERIILVEEHFLSGKFGEAFTKWADHTPTFLPRLGNWETPSESFSFRTVLRREDDTMMAVFVTFTVLESVPEWVATGSLRGAFPLLPFLFCGIILCLTIRVVRKRTRWLHVHGR